MSQKSAFFSKITIYRNRKLISLPLDGTVSIFKVSIGSDGEINKHKQAYSSTLFQDVFENISTEMIKI